MCTPLEEILISALRVVKLVECFGNKMVVTVTGKIETELYVQNVHEIEG